MKHLPFEYAVRNLGRSRPRAIATLLGGGLVVLLVLAAGGFVRGMNRSLGVSGVERNVMLLGAGSEESVERSEIDASTADMVAAAVDGIASRLGVSYVSPEVHMAMFVRPREDSSQTLSVVFRGVRPEAFLVHPQVRVVAGRAPEAGRNELLVGGLVARQLGLRDADLGVGGALWIDDVRWTIVGRFAAPGTVMEGEIWVPLTDLQIATKRNTLSCVVLTLGDAEYGDVDVFCKSRLDLELVALRESDYYAKLHDFYGPIRAMVWATAVLIGIGGLLGGLNTQYAAFAARIREMATLQALGFSRPAIVLSLVQESLVATAASALVAAGIGLVLLDGLAVRFSMGSFGMVIDGPVLAAALGAGLALGVLGALPPAWRCLRIPIPDALRRA